MYKLRKAFFLNYITYRVDCLNSLLHQGITEPVFYGDLIYKFQRKDEKPSFSNQFINIIERIKGLDTPNKQCYSLHAFKVYSYGFLFNCMMVGQASVSMTALM